jgi:hypothetical protein
MTAIRLAAVSGPFREGPVERTKDMTKLQRVLEHAKSCKYRVETGINWTWIHDITSENEAETLLDLIDVNGLEHRGIYTPDERSNHWSIRVR